MTREEYELKQGMYLSYPDANLPINDIKSTFCPFCGFTAKTLAGLSKHAKACRGEAPF